jgi:hypothetical protein
MSCAAQAIEERRQKKNTLQREWKARARSNTEYKAKEIEYQRSWRAKKATEDVEWWESRQAAIKDRMRTEYAQNPAYRERAKQRSRDGLARKQAFVDEVKVLVGCQSCRGVFHPAVYDFHHPNPDFKDTHRPPQCLSWGKMTIEIAKCLVVCSNCHREHHHVYRDFGNLLPQLSAHELSEMSSRFRTK